ncbi:uncharacterized protein LACBIDRAFT_306939 [Laccaria bicolor S238N-H82]|uniref:Predicted protein n=1 Tax=Laccaria bicolor (strain S238N-H82 / ATCC MYA-4686) TaxID=486041 RepID=B0E4J3_LACBS|nr:uncharacterized protein LACBIDRAFT_306939 [Laccaria bicolor S238N-H82]EDQ98238.1 predicted protein [Laccaria bicolor S238N-H82]|eukprot:XP_001891111.1 predicted protein [Laccaria bicolor S238N-H82]
MRGDTTVGQDSPPPPINAKDGPAPCPNADEAHHINSKHSPATSTHNSPPPHTVRSPPQPLTNADDSRTPHRTQSPHPQ